jgi:hypothetical protein
VDVGRGVSEGGTVGVSVGKEVGETVADEVAEGSGEEVQVGTGMGVGETMRFSPPHAMRKKVVLDMSSKNLLMIISH